MTSPTKPTLSRCKECGAPLSTDARGEVCLRCALDHALEASESGDRAVAASDELAARSSSLSLRAVRYFGDYELLEEIGRGGMGVVYKARQVSLNRFVAVKMLLSGELASREFVQRFRTEASAAALLQHPNIVAIHEVGVHDGQHYFSMDYVEGPSLGKLVAQQPLPARRAASYVKTIAEAIHYAHERGVLHRDLKPSNVLIDALDQPRVTDFGLAKRFGVSPSGGAAALNPGESGTPSDLTITGQVLGSPNYMPPEQAAAKRGKVGKPSDVYSLGAILYHLVTGRPPFVGESLTDTLHQVLDVEPVSPRLVSPSVPRDLETICLKCLEKEPAKRYLTAQALADELGRFLNDEPIQARPVTAPEKFWRWCRRKPIVASLAVSLAFVFLAGFLSVLWQWRRASAETTRARLAETDALEKTLAAENAHNAARRYAYAAEINVALQALAENNFARTVELLDRQRPKPGEEDLRDFEWRYLWKLCQSDERATFPAGAPPSIAFSPDGGLLVSAEWEKAVVRDASSYRILTNLPIKATTVSFSTREKLLAIGTKSSVTLWETGTWREARPPLPGAEYLARFSSDGRWLVAGTTNGFQVWNAETWELAGICPAGETGHFFGRHIPALSANGAFLVTPVFGTEPNECRLNVWKLPELSLFSTYPRERPGVGSATFAPDGKHLLIGRWDGSLVVWEYAKDQIVQTLREHTSWVTAVVVAPDGKTFATSSSDQTVNIWHAGTREHLVRLRGHQDEVWSLAMSPDGRTLTSGSMDRSLKLWDVGTRHEGAALDGSSIPAGFTADGRILVAATANGARVWNLARNTSEDVPMGAGDPHIFAVHRMAVTGEEPIAALGKTNGTVELWNLASRTLLAAWQAHSNGTEAVAFSADGKRLASADVGGTLTVWDLATRQKFVQFGPLEGAINCVTFSPDGKSLAASAASSRVWLWDLDSGQDPIKLPGHPDKETVVTIAFSPDGKLLATCTIKRAQVLLWQVASGKLSKTLLGHVQGVVAVSFSPDGKTLASASHDHKVKLWHVATHQELATFSVEGMVRALRFSPDGRTLAVGYYDESHDRSERIRLWLAPSLAEIEAAEQAQLEGSEIRSPAKGRQMEQGRPQTMR